MKKRYFLYTILFVAISAKSFAQQNPIYSQYWMNKFLLNPAIAGHEGYTSVNLTARKQWAGLSDAPGTVAISGQSRIMRNSFISRKRSIRRRRGSMSRGGKVGLGGYLYNDNSGAIRKTGFQGTYAYHMELRKAQLSFGTSLMGFQYHLDKDEIITKGNDDLIDRTDENAYVLDANFGAYYSDRAMYAGFSLENLFESFFKLNNREGSKNKLERQYNFMSGYRFDVYDFVFLEPSFYFKFSEGIVSQLDLNLTTYLHENYWGGLGFRTGSSSAVSVETLNGRGSSIIIYGGARIDKFYFGYSLDYTLSSIQKYSYGSHEVSIAVKFGDNARRYRWLNRY
jgi:type IX secretion system PorP/SprF family membrane protein